MTVEIVDMMLDKVAIGPVPARVYKGGEFGKGSPVVLFLPTGAFLDSGLPPTCPLAESIAEAGAIVVVIDYGMDRGTVFPKPLEVSFSVFSYLANKRAGLGDRKSLLFIAGAEAGGNIAAGLALKARDYKPEALDGQLLMSPLIDPFMGTGSMRKANAVGMRKRWNDGWSHYLSSGVCHPYAAPGFCTRVAGLAPALVLTAEDDPIRDECLGYADRLAAAGVSVSRHVLSAGTGWSSVYGGQTNDAPAWREVVTDRFRRFVQEQSVSPPQN